MSGRTGRGPRGTAAAARSGGTDIRHSRLRWLVLAVLCVGVFMLLLDGTIVNIAIPSIMDAFDTGFSHVEWVMNAYLLVFAVLLITAGRLGDLYGRKRIFIIGLCVFTLASLACGLAPGIGWLIGFRGLQGLGGAMMMPSTLSIIANVFLPQERGKAMGFWGGVTGFAVALGPSLGGLLVQAESWRWIFFINVPIGVVLLLGTIFYIPESTDPTSVKQMDYPGVAVLTAALFCLTFALVEGQKYGWTSGLILGLFAGAVVGLAVFVWIQKRQLQPLMELGMFKDRTFSVTNGVALILAMGMMGVFFLLPVFMQSILGYSAVKSGLVMTPLAAVVIFGAPLSGMLSDRIGAKWPMFVGMLITGTGFLLTMRALEVGATWQSLVLPFAVSGFGIGMVMPPATSAVMGSVATEKSGQASGVLSTGRQIGSVLGIAVMGALLQNRAVVYLKASLPAKLDAAPFPLSPALNQHIIDGMGSVDIGQLREGSDFTSALPKEAADMLAQMPATVAEQVGAFFKGLFTSEFVHAMRTTYLFSIILVFAGAMLVLVLRGKGKGKERGGEEQ